VGPRAGLDKEDRGTILSPLLGIGDTEADLKTLGVRGCRKKTLDRDKWRDVLEEAKARRGAVAPLMMYQMASEYF
jgi:hypothetical protein